jgi:DNA polymerase-3 subunit alpha
MDKAYALRKNGKEEAVEPLPGTWEVVKDTYGTICYQEQIMVIAKIVAGFDDNQADSYLRKAFAKKKKDKMLMCRQWFIYGKINEEAPEGYDEEDKNQPEYDPKGKHGPAIDGGIARGYTEQKLVEFWTNIEGFADYLFNKSHAACYTYITCLTGWLKTYYPAQFLAALLSMQNDNDKIDNYTKVARQMDIRVKAPDINHSEADFTATADDEILFGLTTIKNVGGASIPDIISNRPYTSIEEVLEKVPKKSIGKRVVYALTKAGAFDEFNSNRFEVNNLIMDIRKDEPDDNLKRYRVEKWDSASCIEFEKEVLGTPVTYVPFWDNIQENEKIELEYTIKSVREKPDKNGNMMAFLTGTCEGSEIKAIVFSSVYCKNCEKLDPKHNTTAILAGKKDNKGTLIVSKVTAGEVEHSELLEDII